MEQYSTIILSGVVFGTLARLLMLRNDYRLYPGYPHGYVTHISLGFIAAALGSVAIPALAEKDFTAVTFLALAAQQFREIRNMERESLARLEERELVPRGFDYIEGIAKVFESRNYLVMATSLLVSGITFFQDIYWGMAAGVLALAIALKFMGGETVGEIATVQAAHLHFEGAFLKADEVVLMNLGLKEARERILKEGLAVRITPNDDNARLTLHNPGQRQAIIHTVATLLGTKIEIGEYEFTPIARKNLDSGEICIAMVPNEPDIECMIEAVKRTPVLESAKRKPLSNSIGRLAAD